MHSGRTQAHSPHSPTSPAQDKSKKQGMSQRGDLMLTRFATYLLGPKYWTTSSGRGSQAAGEMF